MELVLASNSPYRRALLERLRVPFTSASPAIDETALPGEPPETLVARLAKAKANAVASRQGAEPALIIGSDQVAALDGAILGKPETAARARAQLATCSGRRVTFHTGLAVLATPASRLHRHSERFTVGFRALSAEMIERYLELEQPFDSAGSFRVEGLGITLLEALEGRDPYALVGLPLIALIDLLAHEGYDVLADAR